MKTTRNAEGDCFSGLITHELPLENFGKGLEAIRNGEAMKVVFYPEH